ncbi:MAG: D-alanine--D-alanine ligase [Planctomycetes bacterium]|nr:D-alanine--D-alanine ligase [Planctomycetota bacterium]
MNEANARRRLRVTVLCGGPSSERAVSLDSGRAVAEALRRRGHRVHVADIGPDNLDALSEPADVVFPALHGTFGEDGTVQRLMEERGIRFVGSGARASALAIDKIATKEVVREHGLDTPAFEIRTESNADLPLQGLHLPVVVKPADQGSSVATFVVERGDELAPAVTTVVRGFGRALVEQFVVGDELTVGIVGHETLPPICIRPRRDFYDYEAKYQDDATEYVFDAGHSKELLGRARALSSQAFALLECRHLARVDWIVDGAGKLWFLEVNTLPGFTSHSLVPKAAARVGVEFDELVERLVFMAAEELS